MLSYPKNFFNALLLILLFTSCSTSRKLSSQLDTTIEEHPAFKTGFAGIMVYDPTLKKVIFEKNSDKYFTPASNTKLFTFYAGLKILGDSAPALAYVSRNDSLIFKGTGDPSLLYEEFNSSQVLDFLKDANDTLYYSPPSVQEKHFGPGWSWDDYHYYYSVERAAMPVYGNYVSFNFTPDREKPLVKPELFSQFLRKDSLSTGNSSRVLRDRHQNIFTYYHPEGAEERSRVVPFIYTPQLLTTLLSDTLGKPVEIIEPGNTDFSESKTIYSVPMDSLYKRMLQVSDNFIAEQILLMSSGVLSDTLKADITLKYMKENHLQDLPDEPIWEDGSGLSVYNKFTPRSVVKLMEKITEEVPQKRLFQLLPAGGESGTLKNLYKAEEPYIYAKTGTISNVHALSGYLKTKSGKILIFSFMNNNYTVPSAEIKAGMEIILRNIHLNY